MREKRHSMLYQLGCGVVVASVLFFAGCTITVQREGSFSSSRLGVSFDFPEGWSRLSAAEMKKMFPGKGEGILVTIGDPDRVAIVSLVEATLDRESVQAINCYSNLVILSAKTGKKSDAWTEAEEKVLAFYATILVSIKMALPKRYEGFRMLRDGAGIFAGVPVGEFVFEGKRLGEDKEKNWKRLIVMLPKNATNKVVMLAFSIPLSGKAKYTADLKHIEKTWKWR